MVDDDTLGGPKSDHPPLFCLTFKKIEHKGNSGVECMWRELEEEKMKRQKPAMSTEEEDFALYRG